MLVQTAEESYQNGLDAFNRGDYRAAMAYFEAALAVERKHGVDKPQSRYLSFYGLSLGMTGRRMHDGVKFCRIAAGMDSVHSEVHWNFGRVLLLAGRRRAAHRALKRALRMNPGHVGIVRSLRQMGVRRSPVLPFLSRSNPVNVLLGRMRDTKRRGPELTDGPGFMHVASATRRPEQHQR